MGYSLNFNSKYDSNILFQVLAFTDVFLPFVMLLFGALFGMISLLFEFVSQGNTSNHYKEKMSSNHKKVVKTIFQIMNRDSEEPCQQLFLIQKLLKENVSNKQLFFIGRNDTQIKHMGYRIELNELEIVLNKLSSIKETCVFYIKNKARTYGKIISVISTNRQISKEEIYTFIQKYLPKYFLPQELFCVDDLPKNNNGKIDRALIKKEYEKKI